jgi:hypothetical protein
MEAALDALNNVYNALAMTLAFLAQFNQHLLSEIAFRVITCLPTAYNVTKIAATHAVKDII